MKNMFKGYLAFLPELKSTEVKKATICFDTSALLNIYRYPKNAADDFIRAIEYFHENIWLPYFVALEYQSNRINVLQQQARVFDELLGKSKKFKDDVLGVFSDKQHHSIPYDDVANLIERFDEDFRIFIDGVKEKHPNYFRKDLIQEQLMNMFEGKTGGIPSKEVLESLYKEGEIRFENKIPPGYKDAKNKEHELKLYGDLIIKSKYADFIIWYEIIEKAKITGKPVILVTDERKEDWCWKENNIILGARPELVTEVLMKAGVDFRLISSTQFISIASKIRKISISKNSVFDIEQSLSPSWKEYVLQAFKAIGPVVKLEELYAWIEENPQRSLTANWKATARKTIYYYCRERDLFLGKDNLFEALDDSTYKLL
ncbi:DUF4935 domain-containing protein [Salmonella enterica]|nr:hypothetical protein LFZ50_08895 [Salmonella enterica subsp. arizonae serovar 53:-:- str. SA20100345]ECX9456132.1 hypothetical protein [Salmonella enterica]EDA0833651.1 hypothetical protein [Salmonella enterica]EIG8311683.1 DUF4935 domain-containing protein [Salmonella enterica]